MNESLRNNQIEYVKLDSDNFDLRILIRSFLLNKKLIAIITFLSMVISLFYASTKEKIYKGSFQIVLKNDSNSSNNSFSSELLSNALGSRISNFVRSQTAQDINTQVEILKSPSVLMPIFEYVKAEKLNAKKNISKYRFDKWLKKSLGIELIDGTTVLKIEYFDNNKELIFNSLNKISTAYQQYSDKDRITGLESGIKYIENQIEIYKQKSQNSFSEFQKFATENNMNSFFISENFSEEDMSSFIDSQSGIQQDSVLRKRINTLELYIARLENIKNNTYDFELAKSIAEIMSENTEILLKRNDLVSISTVSESLLNAKTNLTENDPSIIDLQLQLDFMKADFVKTIIAELKSLKTRSEIDLQSNLKSDSQYTKYKELARKSIRDDFTLQNLEQQKQILSLEQAKSSKPWELITEPTLFDKPIGLAKRLILLNGLLIGLVLSALTIYLKDRIKDYVYSYKELTKDINIGFKLNIQTQKQEKFKETIKILSLKLSQKEKINNLGLFIVGDIPKEYINKIVENLNLENQFKIVIAKDLLEIQKLNTNLIVLSPGAITRTELKNLKQNINVQGISFLGALIIDLESLSFSENYLKREELLNQFRGKYQDLLNIFRN
tara:strand:- start:568 stop:2403 length:1836 start_codon:yes stop_codon:yes gene_type:complete